MWQVAKDGPSAVITGLIGAALWGFVILWPMLVAFSRWFLANSFHSFRLSFSWAALSCEAFMPAVVFQ